MRTFLFATAIALVSGPVLASEVFGIWKSEPNDEGAFIHVEVGPCAEDTGLICGRIIGAFNGDPDRSTRIVGRNIIENMEPDGASSWDGGTIWAPDDDETYSSEMELDGDVLRVSGCVLGERTSREVPGFTVDSKTM